MRGVVKRRERRGRKNNKTDKKFVHKGKKNIIYTSYSI